MKITQNDGSPDQYDLPPPSTGGVLQPDVDPSHANGSVSTDEQTQWAERVGWASRFGQGSITEAEAGESLLDHQTFLESKLDDKWFGGEFDH